MLYRRMGSMFCHLRFLKKNIKKIKIKNKKRCMSLFESLMESIILQNIYFFSFDLSHTRLFS